MELYRLLENGAVDPSDGIYYGEKGQIVCSEGRSYRILSPKEGQSTGHFVLLPDTLEKL